MQIALDGSDLAAERVEGPSVYAGELLPRLSQLLHTRGHMVRTYAPGPLRDVSVSGETHVIPGRPFWTQRVLASALWRDPPDVLFLPIQALPVFRRAKMKTVAVVHDLEFLRFPETYTVLNRLLLRFFTRQAGRQATCPIAVSRYTKDEIVRIYGRPPDDITVVHHGVDAERFGVSMSVHDHAVRERLGVEGSYMLSVGSLQPRKNLPGLLTAYERLAERNADVPALLLVAGGSWKEAPLLRRLDASPRRGRIKLLRRVSPTDIPSVFRGAALFVLPSLSEGFGMAVLEAMAAGVPVVVSRTSSLPEVAGDAAEFVDPRDPGDIARGIIRVLEDATLREQLVARGRERARSFTWGQAAEQTADVIEATGHKQGTAY